ncbi:MAG: DUF4229 domain-containing protein [Propionibacteriales bacterium]|nr:DUF4229 domain-containing protein [Propionibacteriales bacterium]
MKILALYTAARLLVFAAAYALIWGVFGRWLEEFNSVTALWTALIALVVSSVISLIALRPMRERLAIQVEARARRVKTAFDEHKRAEDE